MIDNEIVKTWNEEIHLANYVDESYRNGISISLIENTLDLINRLQAEKEALIAGQETLQKALAEKIEEVESLRYANKALVRVEKQKRKELWEKAKAEAVKEVTERLKTKKTTAISCDLFEEVVRKSDIDNLVKEKVGEK